MKLRVWSLVSLLVATLGACSVTLPGGHAVNPPGGGAFLGLGSGAAGASASGSHLRVADGFKVDVYADDVRGARWLVATEAGDLLVSQPDRDRILLLGRDEDHDLRPDSRRVLIDDLNGPHGIDVWNGWLYVGEMDAVGRVRFDVQSGTLAGKYTRIVEDIPSGGNHWTRSVAVGPDDKLYLSIGSSCNVCIEDDPRRAAIMQFESDGSDGRIYATGLRNAVGFAWRPETGALYATDNGRDWLGDNFPPCELNRIVEGGFYGWPYVNGNNVPDPDFGTARPDKVAEAIPPAHAFDAHNAPLGITFLSGGEFHGVYDGAALVALHGSWNRSRKDGYEVVSLHWNADGSIEERPFLTGFLEGEDVRGRPVDVAQGENGHIYVSDDYADAIYLITRDQNAPTGP